MFLMSFYNGPQQVSRICVVIGRHRTKLRASTWRFLSISIDGYGPCKLVRLEVARLSARSSGASCTLASSQDGDRAITLVFAVRVARPWLSPGECCAVLKN